MLQEAMTVAEQITHAKEGGWMPLGVGIGAGLAVLGGGLGIGRLAAAACEGTARQPEAGGAIRTNMLITAGMIEGATLFAIVLCLLLKVL